MELCNIWYCHPYACAPSTGKRKPNRSYFLAKAWRELGHNCLVITSSYEHIGGLKSCQDASCSFECCDGVDFAWLKTPEYSGNGFSRIVNMLAYAKMLKKYADNLVGFSGKPNVIICSAQHPFHFKVCKKIAKKYGAILISEIRDLWPLSLIELLGVRQYHPLCLWLSRIEKKMCLQSDAIVSVLSDADKYLATKGMDQSKFTCIPNGYTPLASHAAEGVCDDYKLLHEIKRQGWFIIGYTGAHGEPNCLRVLCDAAPLLSNHRVAVVLIGDGTLKSELLENYADVENLYFFSPKPKSEIANYQALFDIAYMGIHRLEIYQYGISYNKMYEYLFNRLIILTTEYPSSSLIKQLDVGYYFENDSVNDLVQKVLDIKRVSPEEFEIKRQKGKCAIEERFMYPFLAQQYIDLMRSLN